VVDDAVRRRLTDELGVQARDLTLVLPEFSYRASDGQVEENELCPVYVCRLDDEPRPDPAEVAEWVWWDWEAFLTAAIAPDSVLSPWARLQAPLVDPLLDAALPGLPRRRTA
jgi:isopentenyl-diphosphate delta-isomerase